MSEVDDPSISRQHASIPLLVLLPCQPHQAPYRASGLVLCGKVDVDQLLLVNLDL